MHNFFPLKTHVGNVVFGIIHSELAIEVADVAEVYRSAASKRGRKKEESWTGVFFCLT
jgi:molybdopterin-binding protein